MAGGDARMKRIILIMDTNQENLIILESQEEEGAVGGVVLEEVESEEVGTTVGAT